MPNFLIYCMKKLNLLAIAGTLTLLGCNHNQDTLVSAQLQPLKTTSPLELQQPQKTPVVSPRPQKAIAQATPLTYKLVSYNSQVLGASRTYGVSLPPNYEQNSQECYPVIFLLHGGHGSPTDWFDLKGSALTTLQQLYASSKLPPSIIITPDGNDKRGSSPYFDPQYFDGANGKISTAIGDELVKVVQNRYRTLPTPDFWAMGGLSSGGWGAINVGLHNLNSFAILFSHSGYFVDASGPQNSPLTYIKNLPPKSYQHLRIYLDTGKNDTLELKEARQFSQILSNLQIPHQFSQFSGGHTWSYWRKHLADSLTYVGEQLQIAKIAHSTDKLRSYSP